MPETLGDQDYSAIESRIEIPESGDLNAIHFYGTAIRSPRDCLAELAPRELSYVYVPASRALGKPAIIGELEPIPTGRDFPVRTLKGPTVWDRLDQDWI